MGVTAVNANLVVSSSPTNTSYEPKFNATASLGGIYALIAGGYDMNGSYSYYNTVNAYNKELIRTIPASLSIARRRLTGVSLGDDYVLFGNGQNDEYTNGVSTVDAYSRELVRSNPTGTSFADYWTVAASLNKTHAIFAGGYYNEGTISNAYNTQLTKINAPSLRSSMTIEATGVSFGSKAIFVGKGRRSMLIPTYLNVYDENLLHTSTPTPGITISGAATALGDYIVGCTESYYLDNNSEYVVYNCYYSFNKDFIYNEIGGGSPDKYGRAQSIGSYAIFTSIMDVFTLI